MTFQWFVCFMHGPSRTHTWESLDVNHERKAIIRHQVTKSPVEKACVRFSKGICRSSQGRVPEAVTPVSLALASTPRHLPSVFVTLT